MPLGALSDEEKRTLARSIGEDLATHEGKKNFYSTDEVRTSLRRRKQPVDWDCWAYCFFSTPEDFRIHHESIGEVCDFAEMKSSMVAAVTDGASSAWFDADLSWLEWPDIDISGIFDFLDF